MLSQVIDHPLFRAFALGAGGFFVSGVIFGDAISVGLLLFATLLGTAFVLLRAAYKKQWPLLWTRFQQVLICGACLFAAGEYDNWNTRVADRHAALIIEACNRYHAKYQRWPERLEQVTPEFLPSIPPARYTVLFAKYSYNGFSHTLGYDSLPLMVSKRYSFEKNSWVDLFM